MRLGIDISTYFEEMEHGAKYFVENSEVEPLELFRANGVDTMRIRIWVNPRSKIGEPYLAGTCDLNNFLRLANLAKGKGYKIMLDFHYSDFWADPSKQFPPKGWEQLDADKLAEQVYQYTKATLETIRSNGIEIEFIQVGNEITNGMLWPLGHLEGSDTEPRTNYENLIKFLKAGISACREIMPKAGIVLHLEKSYDKFIYNDYLTHMQEADVDYDIIGYSYYPYWHGTFDMFFENVEFCKKFGKRQMVVELGYAFTEEDYIKNEHGGAKLVISEDIPGTFDFRSSYPYSVEGQKEFVRDFLQLAEKHGIEAVYYWEPLWIPGDGICWASDAGKEYIKSDNPSNRNEWANQCLFDYTGRKLPAFDEFRMEAK